MHSRSYDSPAAIPFLAGQVLWTVLNTSSLTTILFPQPSHRKRLKTAENKGFLTFLNALGRSVPLKTPIRFQIANKINGFVHVSYGTALYYFLLLFVVVFPGSHTRAGNLLVAFRHHRNLRNISSDGATMQFFDCRLREILTTGNVDFREPAFFAPAPGHAEDDANPRAVQPRSNQQPLFQRDVRHRQGNSVPDFQTLSQPAHRLPSGTDCRMEGVAGQAPRGSHQSGDGNCTTAPPIIYDSRKI